MSLRAILHEQHDLGRSAAKWLILSVTLGVAVGSACALFLWSLEIVTQWRADAPWLLYLLPMAGVLVALMYAAVGKSVEGGNNLIVDEIHEPGGGVPLRMAPLVLVGTILTHLCGGSAGREGTAVQMGGSLASGLARWIPGLSGRDVRYLLMAGIAAGFGGVFGTPVSGAIFAMEVLVLGRLHSGALLPCLIASIASDYTCSSWGIGHIHYHVSGVLPGDTQQHLAPLELLLVLQIVVAGVLFGLTSRFFAEMTHGVMELFRRFIRWPTLRPVVGGVLVIVLVFATGTRDYLGLGVTSSTAGGVSIVSCFQAGGAHTWSWLWKIVFTAITLGSGFKGGEVTPLFFIGAALGNTLAVACGAPVDLFAALGFVAVFAGATNTPIACTIMAIELFGGEFAVHFAIASSVAYLFSGHSGIYLSQRIGTPKVHRPGLPPEVTLRSTREAFLSGRQRDEDLSERPQPPLD